MSVDVMSLVWKSGLYKGTDLMVLLGLADRAGDDGGNAFPGNFELGWKARVDDRSVQRSLKKLQADQVIQLTANANGGRGRKRVFTINVPLLRDRAAVYMAEVERRRVSREAKGDVDVTLFDENPDTGVTLSTPNPDTGVTLSAAEKGDADVTLSPERVTPESLKGDTAVSPERQERQSQGENHHSPRATALSPDFVVPAEWRAEAEASWAGVDIDREAWRFVQWHRSKGAERADWHAAWLAFVAGSHDAVPRSEAPPPTAQPAIERSALQQRWDGIREALRSDIGDDAFRSWIKPLGVIEETDERVTLSAPTRFMADWVNSHYAATLTSQWGKSVVLATGASPKSAEIGGLAQA